MATVGQIGVNASGTRVGDGGTSVGMFAVGRSVAAGSHPVFVRVSSVCLCSHTRLRWPRLGLTARRDPLSFSWAVVVSPYHDPLSAIGPRLIQISVEGSRERAVTSSCDVTDSRE